MGHRVSRAQKYGQHFLMNSAAVQEENNNNNNKNNEIMLHVLTLILLVRYAVVVLVHPTFYIVNFHLQICMMSKICFSDCGNMENDPCQ